MKAPVVALPHARAKNLLIRIASSVLGIPILIAVSWYGNTFLVILVVLVSFIAAIEFFAITKRLGYTSSRFTPIYAAIFALAAWRNIELTFVIAGALLFPLIWLLFSGNRS